MNRQDYNDFRGWELPEDENGRDEGFLVEYIDGGKANTEEFEGYVSWSPKEVFEKAYKPSGSLDFGAALMLLKSGFKVARKGWNGKGMFIFLVGEKANASSMSRFFCGREPIKALPSIGMYTADASGRKAFLNGWLASQTDMLSNDWEIVE